MRREYRVQMGPNAKSRPRKHYVQHRLRILKELCIAPPPQSVIEQMLDDKHMSEIAVDAIFLQYIKNN